MQFLYKKFKIQIFIYIIKIMQLQYKNLSFLYYLFQKL